MLFRSATGVRVEVEHVVVVRVVAPHGGQVDVGFPQTEAVVLIVEHPAELASSAGSPTPAFDVSDVEVLPVDDREMVVDEVVNIQVATLDGPVVARICHRGSSNKATHLVVSRRRARVGTAISLNEVDLIWGHVVS